MIEPTAFDRELAHELTGGSTEPVSEGDAAEVIARARIVGAAGALVAPRPRTPSLADAVRQWAGVNGGELNRLQVRELLRELDRLEAGMRALIGEAAP